MTLAIEAKTRIHNRKQVSLIRKEGLIPAVVYGNVKENIHVQLDGREFKKIYSEAGVSTLVDLTVDGKDSLKVLIHEIQRDAVTRNILHADLFVINMKEKIRTSIELHFIGESKAIKELSGILVKNNDSVEIECLPADLVSSIEVDISQLETFEDKIVVSDLPKPKGIEFLDKSEIVIAFVSEPRSEEEIEALDEKIEGDIKDVEVEDKGKKEEEEEGEEGETKKEESKDDKKDDKKEESKEPKK